MKFEKLVLEKYGLYENREIHFRPNAHLHVIAGRNEAGKTSALSAIGDLLFSFPNQSAYAIGYSPNTMRLGAALILRDGSRLAFRRRKGRSSTIVDENDKALGDDLLDAVLGATDRVTFENEFGLTAERLRAGGDALLKAGGDLAESLAAGSAQLSALNRLRMVMQAQADDIFTARKVASKIFYVAAGEYTQKSKDLREAIVTADAVKQAEDACTQLAVQQEKLAEEHAEASRRLSRLQRARNTRAKLQELETIERELASHPALPNDAAGRLAEWRSAVKREAEIGEALAELKDAIVGNAAAVAALSEQPDILDNAQGIAGLHRASGAAEDYRKDLPHREREHHAARSKMEAAARSLGLASTDLLLEAMPTRLQLASVRETLQKRRESAIERKRLRDRLGKSLLRREALERQIGQDGHAADPADLKGIFESFARVPGDAEALQRQRVAIRQNLRDIENRLSRLSPPVPQLRDLVAMPLPDASKIDEARREEQSLIEGLALIDRELEEHTSALDTAERSLQDLEQTRALVTRDDLAAARTARDAALAALQGAKSAEREVMLRNLAGANEALDRVTDELLANADGAGRKLALEQECQRLNESITRSRETKKQKLEAQKKWMRAWLDLWAGMEIEPDTPAAMARWLNDVSHAIADHDALSGSRKELDALRERLEAQRAPLTTLSRQLGAEPIDAAPLEQLYALAEAALDDIEQRWTERRLQAQNLENAIRESETIEAEIEELDGAEGEHREAWQGAMAILQCRSEASHAEADEALRIWDEALIANDKFSDETSRLTGVRKRIGEFEARVRDLCAHLAPDLGDGDPFHAVDELNRRLQVARDTAKELQHLRDEEARLQKLVAQHEKERGVAQSLIRDAVQALALTNTTALEPALDQLERRGNLLAADASARRDLAAMTNGLSLEELREEQADVEFDGVDGQIELLQNRLERIREEEKSAYAATRDAERVRDELLKGRNAAAIAQQKQEAAAELLDVSRQWLAHAAAARLAGQAIEQHRQSVQNPVLARASNLFARATGGAYSGLADRFDDNDELVFKAVRAGGEDVDIAGLSDGTRDQLFLALRLALLERRGGEPLPFIGDDILTSFDEVRAGHAIAMLAECGKTRQTILFSHHRHVAEIARTQLGDKLDLIDL